MKLIKLNESQYKRLFENYEDFADNNQSQVPTSLSPSETPTMTVGGIDGENGETEFVDKSKKREKNYLSGAGVKQNAMGKQYPFGFTNMGRA